MQVDRVDFGEFTSTPLRLLLCLWHCVDTVSRELTATPIIHLGQGSILDDQHLLLRRWHCVDTDGREEGRVSWQCIDTDGREFTSTPIMHLGQGSIAEG